MGQWADLSNYSGERFRRVRFLPQKGQQPRGVRQRRRLPERGRRRCLGRTTRDALAEFTATPLPDAIDGLLFRVSMVDPTDPTSSSGFDAYAARPALRSRGAQLRAIAVELRWSCVA